MAKWVATVEITEKHRYVTKNMFFSLSEKSCSSEVFKFLIYFLVKLQTWLLMNFEVTQIFHGQNYSEVCNVHALRQPKLIRRTDVKASASLKRSLQFTTATFFNIFSERLL